MAASATPEIFDRRRRRILRDRAARRGDGGFVRTRIVEELLARLDGVTRSFATMLDLGCAGGALGRALAARGMRVVSADAGALFARMGAGLGVQCDEDRLPFGDARFDLVIWAGGLDSVNDVPGALALVRRLLVPDGLFLAGFVGAGSLARLRAALLQADLAVHGGAAPRVHPQIDVRAAGDLLQRAGFALPVADGEGLDVRYRDLPGLVADIRDAGAANLLASAPPLGRLGYAAAHAAFAAAADADGRTTERLELVYLSGWAPAPGQPKPARRGSGTVSLAEALRPKR